ncbi:YceI-like domain-containing protein [Pseudarcicella hirudinis]|uniref:YceI-like domain-containing protein n=1 Tax=Pseudarcicella hirudinis TaxID=1079859 RepID=A0A1I5WM24_9BACT|nr:YceI family protein [Pseudarcicella hirudinis]SFQ20835.1 YceI-like domain-containing protein [Pseudarcicella hirudinis]
MKKLYVILISTMLLISTQSFGQLYATQSGETSFFSSTPVEDISAVSKTVGCILNTSNGEVAVSMQMSSFDFPNNLMQEHFNESYIESDTYPTATFTGKILETINYTKNGSYPVTARGKFTVHGVTMDRDLKGVITVENQRITLTSNFDVKVADHKIEVPKLVFAKIAEVITVKNKYVLAPYVKKQ